MRRIPIEIEIEIGSRLRRHLGLSASFFDGATADGALDRRFWTGGLAVFLAPGVVLKLDVSRVTDDAGGDPGLLVNAGVGFAFPR